MSTKLLLVTPTFHDYWRSIAEAFATRGYEVSVCRYDEFATGWDKAGNKLRHELPERLGRGSRAGVRSRFTARAREAVTSTRPDVVVTVKGDLLDAAFFDAVDQVTHRHVLWLYDELRRTAHTEASLVRPAAIASYSPQDVQALITGGHTAAYVPLAFDPGYVPGRGVRTPDVTFVGARYPGREAVLGGLARHGIPVTAYGRQWSHHPFDRLRTWQWQRPELPAGRDLDRPDAYAVMADSLATLNIHGDQDGFTVRTFEACGVGALQLIDRVDVGQLYEPGIELLTFTGVDDLVDLHARVVADPTWAESIREAGHQRTLADHTFVHRAEALEALWG
ncbi:MAG: glycosyltransferase [Nostocoides sp.]